MRLIDADVITDHEIIDYLGISYASCLPDVRDLLDEQPTIEAVPVVHGEWEWFEEWMPSTTENLRECEDCGWRCSQCKTPLEDMVGGYWDNPDEQPKIIFCPNCGAKMEGGAE